MKDLSRREFFKISAGGLAFLSELSVSREARAKLEEIFAERAFVEEDYEKGIDRLRTAVFEKEIESNWLFVEKGKKHGWLDIGKDMSIDSGSSIELLPILEDRDVSRMHFSHTHPIAVLKADKEISEPELEDAKKVRKSNLPSLPSPADIRTRALQKIFLRSNNLPQKLEHSVFDPSGRWFYDVDVDHPMIALITKKENPVPEDAPDTDKLVPSPGESAMMRMGFEIAGQQDYFRREKRIALEPLLRFQERMKKEWGVELRYEPYP
ncbi:MAG: hypothetical protein A2934_00350 [Candidatus Sungbacteria bacterium RIFCSPLOWO2_01_FULL_47_10]|uniref:Uncharacterized protein n=1 Tax=Candidatus Sungbacteria bacterium RIFCSPLOWO2_01_FULL_47_10 TaxID=1802276 RepID=A0A1G2KYX6_9BACT|nr:MAG: hypothetical protein A2934_00350 [Candidatus Sungbacteria bacterium RIFCSPLOWO2_01_FULL_47_10]